MTELEKMIERYHRALNQFVKGNPEPTKFEFSRRDDVSLANPLEPAVRGWNKVTKVMDNAAANIHEGTELHFERVAEYFTAELAFIVEVERTKARLGANQAMTPFSLRVTTIFRPEDGTWKVVHRHADSINSPRPAESMIEQ